jgi:hypothetical protein
VDGKQQRDFFGAVNAQSSDNFVLRWGNSNEVVAGQIEAMLDALEQAWSVEVIQMEHPVPDGADEFRFNVYVADTGVEGPWGPLGDYGAAGWFYPDDGEGYPFVVLSKETLADLDAGGLTAAHELYHAIQYATGRYREEAGAWFWEASATWIEAEVFPDSTAYTRFLYGYALLPHLPMDSYAPFETGSLDEYHAYGAFIFPRMLSEHAADWRLVRDVWVEPAVETEDPLDAIAWALEAQGSSLGAVFSEFSTRNIGWEYAHGEAYAANLEALPIEFESKSHRFTESHEGKGTAGWDRVPGDLLPGSLGSNLLLLQEPSGDVLYARVEVERLGSIQASLVVESAGTYSTHALDFFDGIGGLDLALSGEETRAVLVLAAVDREAEPDTRFGYAYQLSTEEPDESSAADSGESGIKSCGCSVQDRGPGRIWLWLLGFSALRARRP